MSLPTPEGITYGLVVARWLQIVGDTPADLDALPDTKPMSGSALFTRKQKTTIRADSTQPDGTYVGIAKQNINGYLRTVDGELARAADSEDTGLWLVTGVYTVSFSLSGTTWPSFDIEVTAAHTAEAPLDLITTTPYVPPIGATPVVIMVPASIPDGYLLAKNGASFTGVDPATLGGAAPDASETVKGIVELATSVETVTGEDGVRAVTPAGVKAALDAKSVSDMSTYATKAELAAAGGSVIMDDTPAAPAEGTSATYFVTSAVTWPAGLEWSTDPDNDVAPTITGTALVSMFTLNGTTRAVLGATFPALPPAVDGTAPTAGTLSVIVGSTTADLTVTGATDETALHATPYAYSSNNGGAWTAYQAGATYEFTGLTASTAYTFRHKVKDAAGNETVGTAVTDTTDAPPADSTAPTVPANLTATATGTTTVSLSWTASTDAVGVTGYEYRIDGGTAVDAGTGTTETVTGLTPATEYDFEVRAYDAAGNRSAWSTVATETTSAVVDTTTPTAGTLAGSSITDTGFTLTVTGATDETALAAEPYSFDPGTGVFGAYQASASIAVTGKTFETGYTCQHRVKDAAGNVATGIAITVTTADWTPASITDIEAWFDAADAATITESGGAISQWDDKSGNGHHAIQITGSQQPTYDTTSLAPGTVLFGGTQHMASPASMSLPECTTFIVGRRNGSTGGGTMVGPIGGYSGVDLLFNSNSTVTYRLWGKTPSAGTGALPADKWVVAWGTYSDVGDLLTVKVDNYTTQSAGMSSSPIAGRTMGIGAKYLTSWVDILTNGNIAEIIHVGRVLTAGEITAVTSYLQAKWGVTFP